jgi:hypothetical protein
MCGGRLVIYGPDLDVAMSGYSIPRVQATVKTGNRVVAKVEWVRA